MGRKNRAGTGVVSFYWKIDLKFSPDLSLFKNVSPFFDCHDDELSASPSANQTEISYHWLIHKPITFFICLISANINCYQFYSIKTFSFTLHCVYTFTIVFKVSF